MNQSLKELEPQLLWNYFSDICSIPHPSKHEQELIAYIKNLANENEIAIKEDSTGNLFLSKQAKAGCESYPAITFQAHLDMVPQANSDTKHDFKTMPITPIVDRGWVTAQSTTLGADNGVGLAAILALFTDQTIKHGPIEALFTIDEETGMTGAFGLEKDSLSGKVLINLDSEEEGELFIGCAGGINTEANFSMKRETTSVSAKYYQLSIKGFKGGHSGCDINLERGNAIIEFARVLLMLQSHGALICDITGGSLRNAIPREANTTLLIPVEKLSCCQSIVSNVTAMLHTELGVDGEAITLKLTETSSNLQPYDSEQIKRVFKSILAVPNGVLMMNRDFPGVVESSSNIGVIYTSQDTIAVKTLQRASLQSLKEKAAQQVAACFELADAQVHQSGEYPGWKPNRDSRILLLTQNIYRETFNKEPKIQIIHAGLECGLLYAKNQHMDVISFGPTIKYPHSPDEKVDIGSVGNFWKLLVEITENINNW